MQTLKVGSKGEDVKKLQSYLNLCVDGIFGKMTEESVKQFQKENKLTPDGVVGPTTWQMLEKIFGNSIKKSTRKINEIILHCSATPEGKDFTTSQIKSWHLQRGFSDIGYHYVIYRDGSIHIGRDESVIGAHCTGHNTNSIGVCYIGGCASDGKTPKDTRTTEQKQSLVKLLKELKTKYPQASIHGHRDFSSKACPSFDATKEYSSI